MKPDMIDPREAPEPVDVPLSLKAAASPHRKRHGGKDRDDDVRRHDACAALTASLQMPNHPSRVCSGHGNEMQMPVEERLR